MTVSKRIMRTSLASLVFLLAAAPQFASAQTTFRNRRHGLAGGAIAGIVIAIAGVFLLLLLLGLICGRRRRARGLPMFPGRGTGFVPFGGRGAGYPAATDYEAGAGVGPGAGAGYNQGLGAGNAPGGVGTGAGHYAPPAGPPPGAPPPAYAGPNKEGAGVGGFAPPEGPAQPPNAQLANNGRSGRFGWFGNGNKVQ
ncbi:hypothetical protein EIP86_001853 [Pleurotus ostreatoroseus]|nr:hypothetical protein EIP86_001853 [Pleurotus ostreatoroseus]